MRVAAEYAPVKAFHAIQEIFFQEIIFEKIERQSQEDGQHRLFFPLAEGHFRRVSGVTVALFEVLVQAAVAVMKNDMVQFLHRSIHFDSFMHFVVGEATLLFMEEAHKIAAAFFSMSELFPQEHEVHPETEATVGFGIGS